MSDHSKQSYVALKEAWAKYAGKKLLEVLRRSDVNTMCKDGEQECQTQKKS